jgi:hypothetical protein
MLRVSHLQGFNARSSAAAVSGRTRPTSIGTPTRTISATNQATITVSHTVPANTDLLIVRIDGWFSNGDREPPTSVTFGGAALSLVVQAQYIGTSKTFSQIWKKDGPTASTANIVVTAAATWNAIDVRADNFDDVETADSIGDTDSDTGGSSADVSITTEVDNPLILACSGIHGAGSYTWGGAWTEEWDEVSSDNDLNSSGAYDDTQTTAGANVSVTLTPSDGLRMSLCIVEIRGTP